MRLGQLLIKLKKHITLKDIKRTYSLLMPYIKKYWKSYIVLLLTVLVDTFITIGFARFYGNITESAVHGSYHEILTLIPVGVILLGVGMLSSFSFTYFNTIATNGVKKDLKNHLFKHILQLSPGKVSNLRSGELLSHFSNDINGVDGVIGSSLINLIKLPITYICVFIYLFQINWLLCLLSVLVAPIAAIFGLLFGLLLRKNSREIHRLIGIIHGHLNETFQGFSVIRSFTMEKLQYEKYKRENSKLYQLELKNAKLQGFYSTGGQIVGTMTFWGSLSLGALFVSREVMTVGALLTFVNLVGHLVSPLTGLAAQWASYQRSIAALERVMDLLEQPIELKELPSFHPALLLNNSIEFENITFGYEFNKNVLQDFYLKVPAGKVIALVGPSGAGKSTLMNLLQGFYKPQVGQIKLDGIPSHKFSPSELRSSIAHVPQETFLFAGTIRENLIIARPGVTEDEMISAAKSAQIHEFILTLENKYDTEVGERGIKLSGGQKQRIAIARAILKNSPILLLDEATSALDGETEFYVKEALNELMKGRTTIVIAHRLSTIKHADVIMVINNGEIVQEGTHEELIRQEGLYKSLNQTEPKQTEKREISLIT